MSSFLFKTAYIILNYVTFRLNFILILLKLYLRNKFKKIIYYFNWLTLKLNFNGIIKYLNLLYYIISFVYMCVYIYKIHEINIINWTFKNSSLFLKYFINKIVYDLF